MSAQSTTDAVRAELRKVARGRSVIGAVEAGKLFNLSRAASYRAAKHGTFPTIKYGSRKMVAVAALERILLGDETLTIAGAIPPIRARTRA